MLNRAIVALAGILMAAGCENPNANLAKEAQIRLIGMPKSELYSCAGAPDRSDTADGFEYATYISARGRLGSRASFGFGHGHHGSHISLGIPLYGHAERYSCKATFTLDDGRISRIVYGSDESTGNFRLYQCYRIVENCL